MRRDWFSRIAALLAVAAITPVALPVCAETGSAAPASSDGVTTPTQGADAAALAPAPAASQYASSRSVYRGDDALPSAREVNNNPYVGTENLTGDFAYTPPTVTEAPQESLGAGEDLRQILGAEVFDRRINVVTPPDTDVEEVIRLLSEKAELNFLYASGVIKGQVTLNLNNVKLGVALNSLLGTQQLSIVREGDNVMRIAPRVEVKGSAVELRTIYLKLNWVQAGQLDTVLKEALKESGGTAGQGYTKVVAQKETNTLIITDTPGNVALIRDLVAQLDVPEKQVMIEARMVELLISNGRQQGAQTTIEVNGTPQSFNRGITGPTGAPVGSALLGQTASASAVDQVITNLSSGAPNTLSFGGTLGIFGKQVAVNSVLDALESVRRITTLANPRVITLNNQEATIDIKREIPYFTTKTGAGGDTSRTPEFKDAGVSLKVTPNITNTGFIKMQLAPEQLIENGQVEGVPIIDRRSAITNVIVKDEDTVVLGGLREISAGRSTDQVPFIGQAPVIGWFFKSSAKNHRKNELTLFVTPRIIKSPVLTPVENYQYSRLDAHWDLPDYFFDDSVERRERGASIPRDPAMYQVPRLNLPEPTN
jgi:type IV pilus assembly protein PilQ